MLFFSQTEKLCWEIDLFRNQLKEWKFFQTRINIWTDLDLAMDAYEKNVFRFLIGRDISSKYFRYVKVIYVNFFYTYKKFKSGFNEW